MQVRIEELSPVEKKLIVEVPWTTVDDRMGVAYRELAREVDIKGFRRGKVPKAVLQRMFGKRVKAEVAYQLVRDAFINATTEHNLDAVAEPVVDQQLEIKSGEPFAFEARVEVKGKVAAPPFEGLEVKRRKLEVGEGAVDEAIEALRRDHIELQPIEGRTVAEPSDVLTVSLRGMLGDREVDRPSLHVDLEDTGSLIPGLVEALRGIPLAAADHEVTFALPADYHDSNLAGKDCKFTVSVLDARRKQLPELNDDFAKECDKGETVAELKAKVRAELEERQREEIDRETRDAALRALVKQNQIPVARALSHRAAEMKFRRLQMMLGIDPDDPRAGGAFGLDGELRSKLLPQATDEVRGQLLLEAIAGEQKIEVSDRDIDERIADMAEKRGTPFVKLRAEYQRDERIEDLRFQLMQERTLDLILKSASITELDAEAYAADKAAQQAQDAASESAAAEHAHDEGHVHGPDCNH